MEKEVARVWRRSVKRGCRGFLYSCFVIVPAMDLSVVTEWRQKSHLLNHQPSIEPPSLSIISPPLHYHFFKIYFYFSPHYSHHIHLIYYHKDNLFTKKLQYHLIMFLINWYLWAFIANTFYLILLYFCDCH